MSILKKSSILAIVLGVVICSSLTAKAADDPRYRYGNTLDKTINQDWSITLWSEFDTYNFNQPETNSNSHDLNALDQELSLVYSGLAPWIDLGPGIGYWDAKSNGNWQDTTYPYGFITLKKTFLGLAFNDRNRFDAEIPEHYVGEGLVYRNALTIATAKKWTSFELQPFVSDEIFYNTRESYLSENQAFVGFNFKVTNNIGASLSLMTDSEHIDVANRGYHWKKAPIIILSTSINF
jgi:Protein of unknown function (DUF2490)